MQCTVRLAVLFLFAFSSAIPLLAQHGGGGHSGHIGSGHAAGFSGHSAGHAVGHSFGRIFGHHGHTGKANAGEVPLAGVTLVKGKVVQLPGPARATPSMRPRFPRQPFEEPFSPHRFGFFPFRNAFVGCPGFAGFGLPRHRFFFDDDFGCFSSGFFFDPFFFGSFSERLESSSALAQSGDPAISADNTLQSGASANDMEYAAAPADVRGTQQEGFPLVGDQHPRTLLVLREGSMYGLTDYWLDGNRLGYVTDYGAENSVPMERINFTRTFQVNQERAIQFAPRLKK